MGIDISGLDPDDQLFLLLQSMGYNPNIPLWEYQMHKRQLQERLAAAEKRPTEEWK